MEEISQLLAMDKIAWAYPNLYAVSDKSECNVPILEQVRLLDIILTNVQIFKNGRKKIVNFPSDVEDMSHSVGFQFFQIWSIPLWAQV